MLTRFFKLLTYHPSISVSIVCIPKRGQKAKLSGRFAFTTSLASRNTQYASNSVDTSSSSPSSYDPSSRTTGPGTSPKEANSITEVAKAKFDLEALRTRFRELSDHSAVAVRRKADAFTAKTSSTFSQLGSHLNRVTGYEEIEALKLLVAKQGVFFFCLYDSEYPY